MRWSRKTRDTVDEPQGIGIADLLEALRNDIDDSQERLVKSEKDAIFDVEDVEVEVAVNITHKTSGNAGVQVTVAGILGVGGGGAHERGRETGNRLKLRLVRRKGVDGGVAGRSKVVT